MQAEKSYFRLLILNLRNRRLENLLNIMTKKKAREILYLINPSLFKIGQGVCLFSNSLKNVRMLVYN